MAVDRIVCPLCNGSEHNAIAVRGNFGTWVRNVVCLCCGFVFQNPPMSPKEIEQLYRDSHYIERAYGGDLRVAFDSMMQLAPPRIQYLNQHARVGSGVRVLDIGSGCGAFMHALHQEGCDVLGVEPDPEACDFIRQEFKLTVQQEMFGHSLYAGGEFDLVTLTHIFEHMADPKTVLDAIVMNLAGDGCLFIEVPNVLRPYTDEFHWYDWFDPGHLYSFSVGTLKRILAIHGFKLIDIQEANPVGHHQVIWALARPNGHTLQLHVSIPYDAPVEVQRAFRHARLAHRFRWIRDHKGLLLRAVLCKVIGEKAARSWVAHLKSLLKGDRAPDRS